MTRAKICGLTTPDGLDAALVGGAAFVGAVFHPASPRNLSPIEAAALFDRARGRAKIVAVTVDASDRLLTEIALILRPDLIQLHGSETPERALEITRLTRAGVIRALSVKSADDIERARAFEPVVEHLMFDAPAPEGSAIPGGVGARFDGSVLKGHSFQKPWFLAGGLNPGNVVQAVAASGAPLVDVSSGVERARGVKDPALVAAFLAASHAA